MRDFATTYGGRRQRSHATTRNLNIHTACQKFVWTPLQLPTITLRTRIWTHSIPPYRAYIYFILFYFISLCTLYFRMTIQFADGVWNFLVEVNNYLFLKKNGLWDIVLLHTNKYWRNFYYLMKLYTRNVF